MPLPGYRLGMTEPQMSPFSCLASQVEKSRLRKLTNKTPQRLRTRLRCWELLPTRRSSLLHKGRPRLDRTAELLGGIIRGEAHRQHSHIPNRRPDTWIFASKLQSVVNREPPRRHKWDCRRP